MSESSVILEIPIEILHAVFRVEKEDPLKPIMDAMKSTKKIDSISQSVHLLDALSRTSSSMSKTGEFTTLVLRDLWKGKYWTMKEKSLSLDNDITGSIHQLEPIQRLDVNKSEGEVKDLAAPFSGWLAKKSNINRKKILRHVHLESLKPESKEIFLRVKISQKEDGAGRKFWVYEEGPFKQLIVDYVDQLHGFEMDEREFTEETQEWAYSPEIQALREFREKRNEKKALEIIDSICDQIKQDQRPRLDWVKQVVGFRQDMWDAAQEVIRSANERVFILTSFSNPEFSDDVIELLAEALTDHYSDPEILLSFGEPDRKRSPEAIQNTSKYISILSQEKRLKLKGGITPRPSHTKVVISDTGRVFLCSCNLFSGSLDSGVLESGLLIKDVECAKSILEASNEEGWVPNQFVKDIDKMYSRLSKKPRSNYEVSVEKELTSIKNDIKKGSSHFAYIKLERMLRNISERPVWSLIRTLEHRPFMADCIERFDNRIVMASDGLRSNGLDKATIGRIHQRASKSGATVQIWWGRHTPYSKPYDDTDKRGRREAKSRLSELRNLANKGKRWKLIPRHYVEPMETHAKLFIIDDYRLMISSDNTLSFGDTESERGDAGELGIMIDHMRLPIQTRGSMELWLPKEAKISGDSVRWWALLGEEVSMQTDDSAHKILLIDALDSMIERIESNDYLGFAWEKEMNETNSDEITILNRLAKGCHFGMYSIAQSKKKSWLKITKFDENKPAGLKSRAVISLGDNRWKREKHGTN
jgi:hypothetical protein